ncbi:TPM domain-containing protein [Streptomyces xiamenensis]|uniref:TPM domain-containing protein n=1 Tax=Streptomyces xiamenensis TaxID=408015 RepID=UPI0037D01429
MLLRCLTALAGTAALLLPAEYPLELTGEGGVTDRADALGGRAAEVREAIGEVASGEGLQLYAAYVRDFSGLDAQTWTDATAERNQLDSHAVLLAVGTGQRAYAFSVNASSGLTREQIQEIGRMAVAPAVGRRDWAGAAIGAAQGLAAVRKGERIPVPAPSTGAPEAGEPPAGGGIGTVLPLALFAAGVVVLCYLVVRGTRGGRGPRGT